MFVFATWSTTMTRISKLALIAAVTATVIATPAFAQSSRSGHRHRQRAVVQHPGVRFRTVNVAARHTSQNKIVARRNGLHSFAMVPAPRRALTPTIRLRPAVAAPATTRCCCSTEAITKVAARASLHKLGYQLQEAAGFRSAVHGRGLTPALALIGMMCRRYQAARLADESRGLSFRQIGLGIELRHVRPRLHGEFHFAEGAFQGCERFLQVEAAVSFTYIPFTRSYCRDITLSSK